METTFDFTLADSEFVYNIHSTIKLCIKNLNHSVAILYFTDDEMNHLINIPDGIVVYTYDYQNTQTVKLKPVDKSYPLCWTDNYIIEYKNNTLFNINNQRKWNILSEKPKSKEYL